MRRGLNRRISLKLKPKRRESKMPMKKMTLAAVAALFLSTAISAPPASAGGGGAGAGEQVAVDFFGYFLAGGNPFTAVMQMDDDEEEEARRRRWSRDSYRSMQRIDAQWARQRAQQVAAGETPKDAPKAVNNYIEQVASGRATEQGQGQAAQSRSLYNLK